MSPQSNRYTLEELAMYLEDKIISDSATDSEYELYISYEAYGEQVFSMDKYRSIVKKLKREVGNQWDQ